MDTFLSISVSGKLPSSSFVRPYHLVVFENKGHIVEVVAALLIITKPTLIRDVPHWVAKEAGPAGRSSRAGRARAAGPAGQSGTLGGQGGWTSRAETSTDVLPWF